LASPESQVTVIEQQSQQTGNLYQFNGESLSNTARSMSTNQQETVYRGNLSNNEVQSPAPAQTQTPQPSETTLDTKNVQEALDRNKRESDATAASRVLSVEMYKPTDPNGSAAVDEQTAYQRTRALLEGNNDLQAKGIIPAIELAYIQDDKGFSAQAKQPVHNFDKFAQADTAEGKDDKTVSSKDLAAVLADKTGKYSGVDKAIAESLIKSRFFTDQNLSTAYSREQLLQMVRDNKREYNSKYRNISETPEQTTANAELKALANASKNELAVMFKDGTITRPRVEELKLAMQKETQDLESNSSLTPERKQQAAAMLNSYGKALIVAEQALMQNKDQPVALDTLIDNKTSETAEAVDLPKQAKAHEDQLKTLFPDGSITTEKLAQLKANAKENIEKLKNSQATDQEKQQAMTALTPYLEALSIAEAALSQSKGQPITVQQLLGAS
jgi:hypothetical protein